MSPQSIFAFVLLSAFALSTPVHAGVINSNLVSQTGLTAALCTGLEYSAPGVNTLYDACVASKLLVTANTITTRSTAKSGLTTALCAGLNIKALGISQLYDACVAAGLIVTADVTPTKSTLIVGTSTDIYANAFLNAMKGCNTLYLQLNTVLAGIAQLTASTVTSLSVDVIIPTLTKVNLTLNEAAVATASLVSCTDAAVNATVLQSYTVFATNLGTLCSSLSSSLTLYSSVEVKASLHSTLSSLRSTLVVYTTHLDNYLSADLAKSSINTSLFLSVDAALKATA